MRGPLLWDVDPVLFQAGPFAVRWYGLCFSLAILTAFTIWYRRARRDGMDETVAGEWIWWGAAGVLIGGRLGYCLFYAPRSFLADPLMVVRVWEGGIVSHGVAAGVAIGLWAWARRHGIAFLRAGDLMVPALALAVGWIRVGNFFNSEVVGRATEVPWAVVFVRHDLVPRHPAQLYDLVMGPLTWLVLVLVERRRLRPIGSGLLVGTFFTVYFGLRLGVEVFKDFYTEQMRVLAPFRFVEDLVGFQIHTGQWLSIPPFLVGVWLLVRALKQAPARSDDPAHGSAPLPVNDHAPQPQPL